MSRTEPAPDRVRAGAGARLVAVGFVSLAAGAAAGLLIAGALLQPAVPSDASVDAGFARDMQAHHAQAVEMSVLVRDRSDDQEVRRLALDIGLTQQQQQGQMFGWLEIWGLPQSAPSPMAWLADEGHGSMSGAGAQPMPGLATPEQMDRLAAADGDDADRLYLALMIPHHEGGLQMAQLAAERAGQPTVRALAEAILASQETEITVLEAMLDERGGAPQDL